MKRSKAKPDGGEFLRTEQVSARFGIPIRTLEDWRRRGRGPRYIRAGRSILYRVRDVEAWLAARTVDPEAAAEARG